MLFLRQWRKFGIYLFIEQEITGKSRWFSTLFLRKCKIEREKEFSSQKLKTA